MKKFLTILSLAAVMALAGCRGDSNTNTNANANMNTNVNMSTPVPKTTETATVDTATKTKVEEALKKAGFTDVTYDAASTPATLRGTVAKGKMAEAVKIAQETSGKPVKNEVTEK